MMKICLVIPRERIAEEGESEDTDDTDSVKAYPSTAPTEYPDISTVDYSTPPGIESSGPSISSPAHTRSYGKAKKTKDGESFYKGYGVVYLP